MKNSKMALRNRFKNELVGGSNIFRVFHVFLDVVPHVVIAFLLLHISLKESLIYKDLVIRDG